MSESTQYVTYYVATQQRGGFQRNEGMEGTKTHVPLPENTGNTRLQTEHYAVMEFMKSHPKAEVIEYFTETPESRRTSKWPQLYKALEFCKQRAATLLIVELGTLTSNETFSQILLDSGVHFHCIDQPFITQNILEALCKHAEIQRKLHGKLIREGLKMTSAKSGNPNAAEVISKVNKPKIDTAIVFAFLLQPIIHDYRRKGYSQRQMVKTLNEEGFTAPEGGKWVLSQLQKVLDRVRLNEIATELAPFLDEIKSVSPSETQIAEALNAKGFAPIKQPSWDEGQVKKLKDRIQQIQEIVLMNRFVLNLLPILHVYRRRGLSTNQMLKEFENAGLAIQRTEALAV